MPLGGGYVAMNDFQPPPIKRSGTGAGARIINRLFEKKHVRLEEEEEVVVIGKSEERVGGSNEIIADSKTKDEHIDELAVMNGDPSTATTASVVAPHIQESATDIEVHHHAMHVQGRDGGTPGGSDGCTRGTDDDGDGPPRRRSDGPPSVDNGNSKKQNAPTASPDVRRTIASPRQRSRRAIPSAPRTPRKWRGKIPTPDLSGAARKRVNQRPLSQQPTTTTTTTTTTKPPPRRTLHSVGDDGEGIETYIIQADCLHDFHADRGAEDGDGPNQVEDCSKQQQSQVDSVPLPTVDAEDSTGCRESRVQPSDVVEIPEPPRRPPDPTVTAPGEGDFAFTRLASPYKPSRKSSPRSVMLLDVEEERRSITGGGKEGEAEGGATTHVGLFSARTGPDGSNEGEPKSNNNNATLDLRSMIEQSVGSRVEWMMKNLHDRVDGGSSNGTRVDEQRLGGGGVGGGQSIHQIDSHDEKTYSLSRMSSIVQKVVVAISDSATHLAMETTKVSEEESTLPSDIRNGGGGHRERKLHRSNSASASQMIKKAIKDCTFPEAGAYAVDAANDGDGKHGRTKEAAIPREIVVLHDDEVESAVVPPAEITCEQQDLFSVGDLTDYDELSIRRSESYLR